MPTLHFGTKENEPSWGSVDKPSLPMIAFAYPDALVRAGRMTRERAREIPRSDWKLPHHWRDSSGTLYAHRRGVLLAMQALTSGIRGNRVQLPSGAVGSVRAHLRRHIEALSDNKENSLMARKKKINPEELPARLRALTEDEPDMADVLPLLEDAAKAIEDLFVQVDELGDEALQSAAKVEEYETTLKAVGALLDIENDEYGVLPDKVKGLQNGNQTLEEKDKELTDLKAELDATYEVVSSRREKLLDQIIGYLELAGNDKSKVERFKVRAEKMTWEELDAECEEARINARDEFGVSPLSDTPEMSTGDKLSLRRISNFRV